jgi:uncharacterized protein YndB with AHSA1/START domain
VTTARDETPDPDRLSLSFEVAAPVDHAFRTWTTRAGIWWPRGHTVSGDPESVVFEPYVGGRIVERGRDGSEHVWGEITRWDEPRRLDFRWHLFIDPSEATSVSLTFEPIRESTRIRIEQTGFAALGAAGRQRREGNVGGWTAVSGTFVQHLAAPDAT